MQHNADHFLYTIIPNFLSITHCNVLLFVVVFDKVQVIGPIDWEFCLAYLVVFANTVLLNFIGRKCGYYLSRSKLKFLGRMHSSIMFFKAHELLSLFSNFYKVSVWLHKFRRLKVHQKNGRIFLQNWGLRTYSKI